MKKKGQRPWAQSLRISPPINPRPQRGQWLCSRAGRSAPSSPVPSLAPRASGSRGPRATAMSQPSALVGGELDGNVSSILDQARVLLFFGVFFFFFLNVRFALSKGVGMASLLDCCTGLNQNLPPPPPPPLPLPTHTTGRLDAVGGMIGCSSFLFLRFLGRP